MNHDIAALARQLQDGPIWTRLNPDEIDMIEQAGFTVMVDVTDTTDDDGRRACQVCNKSH